MAEKRDKVRRSEEEWRKLLPPETFEVCRRQGTERAFSGRYWSSKEPGLYRCAACGAPLFDAGRKFDSGTGWPSFSAPVDEGAVEERVDRGHGMVRTEAVCAACDSHLGHVFPDGPGPGGLRYCMNSAALRHEPSEKGGGEGE
jgi:peptide-methionine (R)-S-oxide reductase